ncbi:MAG: protein TolQ [Alphaproteobacteria bacterium]|nr:protein TolQ [Alphaproteobacteria bacterium]
MPTTAPAIQTVQTAPVQTAELAGQATASAPAVDAATTTTAATMPVEGGMSIWDMFWKADFIVMVVMLLLIVTSIWCWTIIINKFRKVRYLNKQAESFEEAFWSGGSLDQLYERVSNRIKDPLTAVFASAMREWRRSVSKGFVASELKTTMQQRIDRVMQVTIGREMEKIERHMGFLASVGSTAPFVGLFGTVWGIMNSFQSIAMSQNTSLAVVAPGIAEALFVTALGLVAAIPAVIAYNKISNDINRYGNRLDTFSNEFMSIISRQLEEED